MPNRTVEATDPGLPLSTLIRDPSGHKTILAACHAAAAELRARPAVPGSIEDPMQHMTLDAIAAVMVALAAPVRKAT